MSDKRDKGGSLVTDYSNSNIEPARAALLNKAELDYVNGIWDDENSQWIWPSYPQLAAKYDLPVRIINEQAGKHKWTSRRERRRTEMIAFQNEQTRKRWLEEEREIANILMNNIGRSVMTVARIQDEHTRLITRALREEHALRESGDPDPIVRVGIRVSEVESLMRAGETAMKTLERLVQRISGLPTHAPELEPPKLIQTVEQEEAQAAAEKEAITPRATVLEIVQEMRKIEELRTRRPQVILMDDDEEEGDDD